MRSERLFAGAVAVSSVTSLPGDRLGGVEICRVELTCVYFECLAALAEERAVHHHVFHALTRPAESVGDEAEASSGGSGREHVSVIAHERVVAGQGTALTLGQWHQDLNRAVSRSRQQLRLSPQSYRQLADTLTSGPVRTGTAAVPRRPG